jgi:integrase/recombinase XerD
MRQNPSQKVEEGFCLLLVMEAVSLYVRTRSEGYSPATLRQFSYQLNRFGTWFGPRSVEDVSLQDLRDFAARFDKLKAQSLGHVVRILRGFFRWLSEEELIPRNPALKLKEPKAPKSIPKALNFEELELLRDACHSPVEHALLEFLFATGCRISEAQGVDRDQIEWDRKCVVVCGKGQKEREVYFGARCALWLRRYLTTRSDDDPALFATTSPAHRMSTWYMRSIIKAVAGRCGLAKKVSPHVMRHTLATILLNQGADLVAVQSILGHDKPETTQRYARLSGARRQEEYNRWFPQ